MLKILSLISVLSLALTIPAQAAEVTWTYDGDQDGQDDWGKLSHLNVACELGNAQSPINITNTKLSYKTPLVFAYKPTAAEVKFENLAITVHVKDAMTLSSETHAYTLETISLHSPSEHLVQEAFYPLEIEFLHKDKEGKRLILSVFAQIGEANTTLEAISKEPALTIDPNGLLPKTRGFYAYTGSLTTPPCTEDVEWRILKQPITLSQEQLVAITGISGRNSRLTQPVYMRSIEEKN